MKKNNLKIKTKLLFSKILNEINKLDGCISVSLVGSFANKFDFSKVADIDFVIVCKNLDKKFFYDSNKIIKKYSIDLLKKSSKKKLLINNTFGPLKFNEKETLVIHLMIYDLVGHRAHVLKSPFTCFDWERSNFYKGLKLKKIFPVERLFLDDFYNSRRGIINYYNDIKKNRISYSEIRFKGNQYLLKKNYLKIDNEEKTMFLFHIFTNLIKNLLKFEENRNTTFTISKINSKFSQITSNKKDFKKIYLNNKQKFRKSINTNINRNKLCLDFLNEFSNYLKNNFSKQKFVFKRHMKTDFDRHIFLGSRSDVQIKKTDRLKINQNLKYDIIYSSELKRSIMTAKFFKSNSNKIIKSNLLNEIDYGKCELRNFDEVKLIFPSFAKNLISGKDPRFPEGENTRDVLKRVLLFVKKLKKINSNNLLVLIVTHNVFLRCLIGHYFKKPLKNWHLINIDYNSNYNFIINNYEIVPNIPRKKLIKLFKYLND